MGAGEKIESTVYMIFCLFAIIVLCAVAGSMAGLVAGGGCEVGAVDANGHSACYNDAWDNTIRSIEGR